MRRYLLIASQNWSSTFTNFVDMKSVGAFLYTPKHIRIGIQFKRCWKYNIVHCWMKSNNSKRALLNEKLEQCKYSDVCVCVLYVCCILLWEWRWLDRVLSFSSQSLSIHYVRYGMHVFRKRKQINIPAKVNLNSEMNNELKWRSSLTHTHIHTYKTEITDKPKCICSETVFSYIISFMPFRFLHSFIRSFISMVYFQFVWLCIELSVTLSWE